MASFDGQVAKAATVSGLDLLLHPELMSQDFMRLVLREKSVTAMESGHDRDHLTELYLRHAIPLPQRTLPNNRWGKRVHRNRERRTEEANRSDSHDPSRKRPLIVFDGSSSHSGPVKLKKPGELQLPAGVADRLKPPPAANLSNPIRRLSGSTGSSSSSFRCSNNTSLKREANSMDATQTSEVKKKIQHVTWP